VTGPLSDISAADREVLERRAEELAGRPDENPPETRRVLLVRVGDQRWALPLEIVREIVSDPAITRVPDAPTPVRGVVSLRGEIVSVTDPGVRLGLGGAARARPVLVVIRQDDVATALAVDAVIDVFEVTVTDIESPLPLLDRAVPDAVAGSFETPDGPVALLSAAPLLEPFGSER
jgi:purine-binding chemotaxis protein CheW